MTTAEKEKSVAALNSVLAAFFITGLKLVVGLMSGSLGVLAEAAHSGLDLVAALVTYFAVRISGKPADQQHLYGHGKVENLSALAEVLLLLGTSVWIVHESYVRLTAKEVHVDASIWTFLVIVLSIIVDVTRSRNLMKVARKHKSQALEADALHFSTDVWSSGVVLLGLAGVKIAQAAPSWRFLEKADAVAALLVAGIVVYVCVKMGLKTINDLLDSAPKDMVEQVKTIVQGVENVKDCHAVRVRASGAEVFIDAHIVVEGNLSLIQAHAIADQVEEAVRKEISGADITVHLEPLEKPVPADKPSES